MPNQPPLNPDALDETALANLIAWKSLPFGATHFVKLDANAAHKVIELLRPHLAAALPEVTEREQLTALPDKIVLEDRRGTIWQKINGTWYTPGSKHDYSDQSVMLPARVLYRPEVKP